MKKISSVLVVISMILVTFSTIALSVPAKDLNSNISSETTSYNDVERWAVIIGTDDQAYCDHDADDMYNALRNNGWESSHIKKYTRSSADKSSILSAISWLRSSEDYNDIVLFFFSGHGNKRIIAGYYGSIITLAELQLAFSGFGSSKMVLIFDTCFAGSLDPDGKYIPVLTTDEDDDSEYKGVFDGLAERGRIIIASCKRTETSWGFKDLNNGVFTYYFSKGFETNDDNNDGWVSAEEAFSYAYPRTVDYTENYPDDDVTVQHPQIYDGVFGEVKITNLYGNSDNSKISIIQRFINVFKLL